ncbi:MAG: DNA cytosine methyltransferase [Bacteroidales bacterium]|nr:DNA cytosine methyltransferase [Bacteroidales bacterium]
MKQLLYIDLFCGAGGTSTGVEMAEIDGYKCAKVIACVNHDANAIASHLANHPEAVHYTEDIRTLDLAPLVSQTQKMKKKYPDSLLVLWASLECTNFSRAKGGKPRDADSRTLAEHLFRYIDALNPDYIEIENVEEFMCWGDMDENGKPVSKHKGSSYIRWCNRVKQYGYSFNWKILNAADFGAYTSRKRFFGQFAKYGLHHSFPEPTHCKNGLQQSGLFAYELAKWKPVREVLDLQDEGESIFTRNKPLCEKTLERIYAGLIKFVAGMPEKQFQAFLVKYNSMNQSKKYNAPGIDEPCPTVACQNRLGIAHVSFLSKQFSGNPNGKNISVEEPAGTITCKDHHAFITAYYGNGSNHSVSSPSPVVTTKDRLAVVQSTFLVNPQFSSHGSSIDKPCFTLIARMDKMPPYLITTESGDIAIKIDKNDTPMMRKVKQFMAMYGIIDIKMRMLKVIELKRIMGFPSDYVLVGTQSEQKKFIGNAVEVNMSRRLCEALAAVN